MFGRVVGVAFTGPLLYFLARGRITPQLRGRMGLLWQDGCLGPGALRPDGPLGPEKGPLWPEGRLGSGRGAAWTLR